MRRTIRSTDGIEEWQNSKNGKLKKTMTTNMKLKVAAVKAALGANGVENTEFLDELVHRAASEVATAVNNEGLDEQVGYLLSGGWLGSEIVHCAMGVRDDSQQEDEDEEIEQRRDEKRGLYPDKIDPAN